MEGRPNWWLTNNCGIEPSQSLELQLKLIMLEPTLARTCRELPEGGTQLGTPKNSWKDSCMSGVFDKNWSTGTINVYESQRCNKDLVVSHVLDSSSCYPCFCPRGISISISINRLWFNCLHLRYLNSIKYNCGWYFNRNWALRATPTLHLYLCLRI